MKNKKDNFDKILDACVLKRGGHRRPKPGSRDRLYTVTTIARSARFGGTRTPVICSSFNAAKQIVEQNRGDIFETSYHLVVIEAVRPNQLYSSSLMEQYWYRWYGGYPNGKYKAIKVPEEYKNTFGFGIG